MAQMKVFVSHSHEDDAFCRALVDGLMRAGADVWYDEHNMGSGALIDKIEVELRQRPVFVVVLSPAALKSQWVRDEAKWAFARLRRDPSRVILPVLAEALPDENDIWLFLQDFKRVEAPGLKPYPQAEAITRTLHTLQLTPPGEVPLPVAPQPSESAVDLVARGRALLAQAKYTDALVLFSRATELDSRSFDAWFGVAATFSMLNRYAESLPAHERATTLDPNSPVAWNNKGHALAEQGKWQESLDACDRALRLDPNYATAWYNEGIALGGLGRYEEELAAYDRALTISPTDAAVWYNKGTALGSLGRFDEALAAFDRALEINPSDATTWGNKGATLGNMGHYEGTLAAFDRALEIDPSSIQSWLGKGMALRRLNRMTEAEEAVRRAKTLGG